MFNIFTRMVKHIISWTWKPYEQPAIGSKIIGDSAGFLKEGMEVKLTYYENEPIDIDLPTSVDLKVVWAENAVKGDTATGVTKKGENRDRIGS